MQNRNHILKRLRQTLTCLSNRMKKYVVYFEADEEVFVVRYILATNEEKARETMFLLGLREEKYKIKECK